MQAPSKPHVRAFQFVSIATFALIFCSCQHFPLVKDCANGDCPGHARVCDKPTVRALAHDLDHLERHIECYGSVTVQHPTVWGQARLTKHREQFEKVMEADLCKFQETVQGALSRSDQAYFANTFALGIAASGPNAMQTQALVPQAQLQNFTMTPLPTPSTDTPIPPIVLQNNPARLTTLNFDTAAKSGIQLEPTVFLNQKARYLQHLNHLRRINEGDDTGDSPGYALNLIRVPVSVLPGKHTQEGHGAEVTMTLKPHLSDELLPTTFRNLVVNDLLEVIGVPLTHFLNDKNQVEHFKIMEKIYDIEMEKHKNWRKVVALDYIELSKDSQALLQKSPMIKELAGSDASSRSISAAMKRMREVFKNSPFVVTSSKVRHAMRPFPPSQMLDVFGVDETDNVVSKAIKHFKREPLKYYTHYPDVQGYLQEELAGAYRFLAEPAHGTLWMYCCPELVTAIHTRNIETVKMFRDKFADHVLATTKRDITEDVTVAFAWAIIVESALLTDHLKRDMRESAAARNCPCHDTGWLDYFMPIPSKEARFAFNRYVECRWPIIVFALDPVADQQNIVDTFSSRREMQLAMSMAFVSGNISAKKMTQYARRLELEAETIALNNTVTSFSHGNETFGWRFHPRFQTPDTESNFTVFFRDQLIGGPNRNALLRQRKLEPGQRECTAIVIMPSFVPYATLETSSTWFKLTNPKHKDMTSVDAVKLSARVKTIENCSNMVGDAHCYRDGELGRLMNRAKQLEARLPLQSAMVQVPYENTLGGFAMFNTGVTDLAPELYGWYGAPGVNLNGETTLFLIGNHFSVHHTRIVVGGKEVVKKELLSRQVMKVTVPVGVNVVDRKTGTFPECPPADAKCPCPPAKTPPEGQKDMMVALGQDAKDPKQKEAPKPCPPQACKELFVDVHVATPYGVTSHLLIPACAATTCPAGGTGQEQSSSDGPCAKDPANPAKGDAKFFCPDDSENQAKLAKEAKAKRLLAETAAKAKADALKQKKDAADLEFKQDLAAAIKAYQAKVDKEQADYQKKVDDRLNKLEKMKAEKMPDGVFLPPLLNNGQVLNGLPIVAPARGTAPTSYGIAGYPTIP